MIKADLKDVYLTFLIHRTDHPALWFSVIKRHCQFTCLPFGLSRAASWVLTKTLKPVTILLRELGVKLVICIDNFLVMA